MFGEGRYTKSKLPTLGTPVKAQSQSDPGVEPMSEDFSFAPVQEPVDVPEHLVDKPLYQGVLRFVPNERVPLAIRSSLPVRNERPFVFVPAGFLDQTASDQSIEKVLSILDLKIPKLAFAIAETEGTASEQRDSFRVQNRDSHPVARDWSEGHSREALLSKVDELVKSITEVASEVDAWFMPQSPRRRNGAAQIIGGALPSNSNAVVFGLMALEEEDEANGFKKAITSCMAPVGTTVRSVAKIDYDPTTKDGTPSPDLSHLLLFESPKEMTIWREKLLSMVPDMWIALGNLTERGFETIFRNVVLGNPIVLIKHTGTQVDNMFKMFRHVNKHVAETKMAPKPTGMDDEDKLKPHIPSIDVDNERIKVLVSTWPVNYQPSTVVLADPLLVSAADFSKRVLGALTASLDLMTGNEDNQSARKDALDSAWSFHDIATRHAVTKKKAADVLHYQMIGCTFMAIAAAACYYKAYDGESLRDSDANWFQILWYVITILLPVYVVSLKIESDKGVAAAKWTGFQLAAEKMESEIFKFRAQVGIYRPDNRSVVAQRKPLWDFSSANQEIWSSVKKHLADDGVVIPDNFWDDGSPFGQDVTGPKEFSPPEHTSMEKLSAFIAELAKVVDQGIQKIKASLPEHMLPNRQSSETTNLLDSMESATGTIKPNYTAEHSNPFDDRDAAAEPSNPLGEGKEVKTKTLLDEDAVLAYQPDYYYDALSASDYIEIRMKKKMKEKAAELQAISLRNKRLSTAVKVVLILGGAFAAMHMQWFVPAVIGLGTALAATQDMRRYPRRLALGNHMLLQLNELKLWWMSLSKYQRQLPHNKEKLVVDAESAIILEVSATFDS